ncbi:MAG: TIM barrel protein, partial [Maioricimonas sp. JB049]
MHPDQTSRRDFLVQASGTVAAGIVALNGTGSFAQEATERTGANRGRIYKANKGGGIGRDKSEMSETLLTYKELGFDGIEGGSPDIKNIPALQEAIAETGVPVHGLVDGVHWKERLSSPDEATRDRGREALEQALRDAYTLRASTVLLVPGRVTGPDENHDHVWERSITEIRKVLPLASALGVQILIENVWNGFCEEPEQLRDY